MKMSSYRKMIGTTSEGDVFLSFHRPASRSISQKALLVSFLLAWLKRYAIPSYPHDDITLLVIFSAVQLVYGQLLGLLPTMVCRIQSGLRALTEQFCAKTTIKRMGKELVFPHDSPSP